MNRANDWFEQAKRDLEYAKLSLELEHYEWVCFEAQQATEKALKGLHMKEGRIVWGHSVLELLEALPYPIEQRLIEKAQLLDKYYVPTRYPNAHPSGPPYRYYNKKEAEQAINAAKEVIDFCEYKGFQNK